jgi:hypothetical protein
MYLVQGQILSGISPVFGLDPHAFLPVLLCWFTNVQRHLVDQDFVGLMLDCCAMRVSVD